MRQINKTKLTGGVLLASVVIIGLVVAFNHGLLSTGSFLRTSVLPTERTSTYLDRPEDTDESGSGGTLISSSGEDDSYEDDSDEVDSDNVDSNNGSNYQGGSHGSAETSQLPCVVGVTNFYLAGGPDSAYCKELQGIALLTAGVPKIFTSDISPETPQSRYTTALAVLRVLNELGHNPQKTSATGNWYDKFSDAAEIKKCSAIEIADFNIVYSSGVLKGHINPANKSQVTLNPLGKINNIELLTMFRQSLFSTTGGHVAINEANLPEFVLDQYRSNPDWQWISESYSFGVDSGIISRDEFSQSSLFKEASRADIVKFMGRFHKSVGTKPSL